MENHATATADRVVSTDPDVIAQVTDLGLVTRARIRLHSRGEYAGRQFTGATTFDLGRTFTPGVWVTDDRGARHWVPWHAIETVTPTEVDVTPEPF